MEIAQLTPDDWELFRDLRLASLDEAAAAFASTLEGEQHNAEPEWRVRLAGRAQFVAREAGHAVGMAGVVREGDQHEMAELVSMWIAPAARRRGVGQALVERAIAYARALGCRELRLHVAEDNPGAERLYVRCGFVRFGNRTPIRPGEPRMRIDMVREL